MIEEPTVIWFDDESELHHPKNVLRSMLPGKRVIFKRRRPPTTDRVTVVGPLQL